MKRVILFILSFCLLLTLIGCGKKETAVTTVETESTTVAATAPSETIPETTVETEPPTEPEPETVSAVLRINIGILYELLDRDTFVDIVGEQDTCYQILTEEGLELLVEKRFVRLDSEEDPEHKDCYAYSSAPVYDNAYFRSEPIDELSENTEVTVLDRFSDDEICYVQYDDHYGYIKWDDLSTGYITHPSYTPNSSGSSGSSDSSSGQDGGEISLNATSQSYSLVYLTDVAQEISYPAKGRILADQTEVYLFLAVRDETVRILVDTVEEDICTVYENKVMGTVERRFLRFEEEEPYEVWSAYSRSSADFYSDPYLTDIMDSLSENEDIEILEDFGEFYLVIVDDVMGYMIPGEISETEITYNYSSGSSSGSSDSSSGSSDGGEWSDPVY